MNHENGISFFKTGLTIKIIVCFAILMLGFFEYGFCQQENSDFEKRPFLLATNRPEGSSAYKFLNLIYSEVFRRLDISFKMIYIPLKRGAIEIDSGELDGETSRVRAYEDAHPNLIRIKEFLYSTDVSAYALNPSLDGLNSWQSLKGTNYRVEYPKGVILSEINLAKVVDSPKLSSIPSAEQGLKRLFVNRIDIYIDDDLVVLPLLKDLEKTFKGKVRKIGIMESVPLYMYIHQKNYFLEARLSTVIKGVRDEGLVGKYRKITYGF